MSLAIITGASSGIGREFALQLKEKAKVASFCLIARRRERLEALKDELGVPCEIITADLTTREGIEKIRDYLNKTQPRVKFLVNSAGFGDFGAFDEIDESTVLKMIDLNVRALVQITHMCVPFMEKGARIIEMGSGSAFTPLPYFNVYSSSKAFVLHYTKSLNYELKKYDVRATCFCPGWVDTEFVLLAKRRSGITAPKNIKPLLNVEKSVAKCVKASIKGKVMCVTGVYTKFQHLLFKIVPDFILTKIWLNMLVFPEAEDGKK
jgi:short-subunit dehydrogenase